MAMFDSYVKLPEDYIYIYMYVCYYVIGRIICCHCRSQGLQDSTKISVPTFEGPWRLDGVLRVISFLALCLLFCLGVGLCWGRVPKIEGLFDGWLQDDSSLTPLNMALHMPPLIAGNIQKTWRKWWETMIHHPQTVFFFPYFSHFQTKKRSRFQHIPPEFCFHVVTHHSHYIIYPSGQLKIGYFQGLC